MAKKEYEYVTIEGIDEINRVLNSLPNKVARYILAKAIKEGSIPIKEAAKAKLLANGSFITGRLYRSIDIVDKSQMNRLYDVKFQIAGRRDAGNKGHHAHLVEYGHRLVLVNPRTKQIVSSKRKRVPAYPFLRPAYDENARKAIDIAIMRTRALLKPMMKAELPGAEVS